MNSITHCHVTSQVNAHTDDYDAPVEGVFDECSPLKDIYETLIEKRKVTFQAGWNYKPTTYTAFDILIDRITDDVDAGELAASIFAAALFNENKGAAATDLAQASEFEAWVFDFFKYLQNNVSHMSMPNLDFLSIRGDV
tara:strand:- start:706 stop:1122 length:417 start_codon:yes stop_codon:yes gene_type:complete